MKLLNKELWNDPLGKISDHTSKQVDTSVFWQVLEQVWEPVRVQVWESVRVQVSGQLDGEIL